MDFLYVPICGCIQMASWGSLLFAFVQSEGHLFQNPLIERFVCFRSRCFHLASAVCFGVAALHLVGYT